MSKRMLVLMCSIFLIVPLLFMGCGGSDGAAGAPGAPGTPGTPGTPGDAGPAGPVTNTNESCMVCHTAGRIADINDNNPTTGMHYVAANSLPSLTVDNIVVTDNTSGNLVVSFTVKIDNTTAYTGLADNSVYFFAADLVPAGTVAAALDNLPQSTAQFERWAFERTGTFATAGYPTRDYVFGTLDKTGAASGNYTYTFATPLGSTTPYDNAVNFDNTDIQRVYIRAAHTVSNTYTAGVGFKDFTLSGTAPGYTVTNLSYLERQFVTIEACQKCHGPKNQVMDHASSYMDINGCVICHSPIINANAGMGGAGTLGPSQTKSFMFELWLGNLIHKIHDGIGSSMVKKQADAEYPQDIRVCVTCHSNPSGKALGAGDQLANWMNHPTAAYCGTCHEGFPLTSNKGAAHGGGTSQPDSACATCHPATGTATSIVFPVATVHNTSPVAGSFNANAKNIPEYDVTLGLSAGSGSGYYKAGDVVTVTATLKLHGTSTAVPAAVYTNAKGVKGIADNALFSASVAIYGPRAFPKPIFAPTDNSQSFNLFMGTTPTSGTVTTDGTGFKYKFTVPSGLANGTYMVRARFGDYGYVSETDYKMESIYFTTIQIGSATVTSRVAGDACTDCHGTGTTAPFHDARHVVAWETDQCISCHDYSGGHAATLSNRVHAVHDANTFGDMVNPQSQYTAAGGFVSTVSRDWSDITYPQSITNCSTCHNSGNTSYRSNVHEVACLGCHGDNPYTGGATNHMLQSGGDYPTP